MIEELRIENFAIIESLQVDFSQGMNALVGETGAGKSIIVEAMGLLSGKRAEFSKVKDESKKAVVEASFKISDSFLLTHPYLEDYLEDHRLVVSRVLTPSKSAIARINGEQVSLNVLKKVMSDVIDIFSQGEASYLLDENKQIDILDSYQNDPQLLKAKEEYKKALDLYNQQEKEIEEFKSKTDLNMKDFYQFQVQEIEKMHLTENEIEDLNQEKDEMGKFEETEDRFKDFASFYYGQGQSFESILDEMALRTRSLEGSLLSSQANKALESIEELESNLDKIFEAHDSLDFSPARLEEINARLFSLSDLMHKYGKSTEEILTKYQELKNKLDDIESFDERLHLLIEQKESLLEDVKLKGNKLTSYRKILASKLEKSTNEQLESLGLLKDGFKIDITPTDITSKGVDQVLFKVALNKGGKYMSLKNAISGGENSRLNLALKTVFNNTNSSDTIVFDEIDSGISGEIAYKAGLKMKEIAKKTTIIVISHLVQVLALSTDAYEVYKKEEKGITLSHIKKLDEEQIVVQMAKMMSSSNVTDASLEAARNMREEGKRA